MTVSTNQAQQHVSGPTDPAWRRELRRRLLRWFERHQRDLPWRRTRDPYAIWVSEIMLQQTRVDAVRPYFERFLARFPTVADLAAAKEQDVLRIWEGLGYYRRARQLHEAARRVVQQHAGQFPREIDQVRALPGIGRYTAGAILSIAFDDRQPILEGNTIRLFSRLLAYRDDPRSAAGQRTLWEFASTILPKKRVGAFNQALMELGSEVCRPRTPQCDACPVAMLCPTRANGWQQQIPVAARRPVYEDRHEVAIVVHRGPHVLLRRCGSDERWAGMWDFLRFPASDGGELDRGLVRKVREQSGIVIRPGLRLTVLQHGVTRFRITLTCHDAQYRSGRVPSDGDWIWVRPRELDRYPLSVPGRKISRLLHARSG
jgi:A/G-specific adenine glycosylase